MPQRLSELRLREVSLVDRPANQSKGTHHAVIALWKRHSSEDQEFELAVFNNAVEKDGKTYAGTTYPASDFAYVPDKDTPSSWKLRLTKTPGGAPDAGIVGAACAALGKGFRGEKVQIPAEALAAVKAKVRAAWLKCNGKGNSEMPEAIQKGEDVMTLQEIEKKVGDQDALIAKLTADNEGAKAETESVLGMSKKDRKAYASMPTEKRKEFMAASEEKRKSMLEECANAKKEKAAADSMDPATKAEFAKAGPARRTVMLAEAEQALAKAEGKKGAKGDKGPKGEDGEDGEDGKDGNDPDMDDDEDGPELKKLKAHNKSLTMKMATLEDAVTKSGATLEEITKRERISVFTKKAEKELPHTSGRPEEKGEMLMKMADALGGENSESFKNLFNTLKSADKALSMSFTEIGKSGASIPALAAFDAKVTEISKRDSIDKSHATEKAMFESPELYQEYEHET